MPQMCPIHLNFVVVLYLKYSCFSVLSQELPHLLWYIVYQLIFSILLQTNISKASSLQHGSLSKFLHHTEQRSTLCILQSSSLSPYSICLSEAIFCSKRLAFPIPHSSSASYIFLAVSIT